MSFHGHNKEFIAMHVYWMRGKYGWVAHIYEHQLEVWNKGMITKTAQNANEFELFNTSTMSPKSTLRTWMHSQYSFPQSLTGMEYSPESQYNFGSTSLSWERSGEDGSWNNIILYCNVVLMCYKMFCASHVLAIKEKLLKTGVSSGSLAYALEYRSLW